MPSKAEITLAPRESFGPLPRIWFGRNGKEHGGEFYLGLIDYDAQSVRIAERDRKATARFLRKFANRLDPPSRKQEAGR